MKKFGKFCLIISGICLFLLFAVTSPIKSDAEADYRRQHSGLFSSLSSEAERDHNFINTLASINRLLAVVGFGGAIIGLGGYFAGRD